MSKLLEAQDILREIGMPLPQQSNVCAYSLLALAQLTERSKWSDAQSKWMRIHDIILYVRDVFGVHYAENSRETIRKQALHHFRNAAIIEDNGKATNSPKYMYSLSDEALELIKSYKTNLWTQKSSLFQKNHERLIDIYASKKKMRKMPIIVSGKHYSLSSGEHNQLQKAILEEFLPRFAPNSQCIYLGDTIKKNLIKNDSLLKKIGFAITQHDKMPDVILYDNKNHWLYFIEAVTSVGAMTPNRLYDIRKMTSNVDAGLIFVTAFPSFTHYKRFASTLAWETEVWIAEMPEHMIHLNGDKFLGPR